MVIQTSSRSLLGGMVRSTVGARGQSDRTANIWKIEKSTGNVVWSAFVGASDSNEIYGLDVDSTGNVYVLGYDTVAQLDSGGSAVWDVVRSTPNVPIGGGQFTTIVHDGSGGVYVQATRNITHGKVQRYTSAEMQWEWEPDVFPIGRRVYSVGWHDGAPWACVEPADTDANNLFKLTTGGATATSYELSTAAQGRVFAATMTGRYVCGVSGVPESPPGSGTPGGYVSVYDLTSGTPTFLGQKYYDEDTSAFLAGWCDSSASATAAYLYSSVRKAYTPNYTLSVYSISRLDGSNVWMMEHTSGSTTLKKRALTSPGTVAWQWPPNVALYAIAQDSTHIYVGGSPSAIWPSAAT